VEETIMAEDINDACSSMVEMIRKAQDNGSLIRLSVLKGRGVKISMPCKILNFDSESRNLSVYHVDNKQVHLVNLYEIDDFIVNS
jgi:hypoxanthine-guanine phosphoribosyltransferase